MRRRRPALLVALGLLLPPPGVARQEEREAEVAKGEDPSKPEATSSEDTLYALGAVLGSRIAGYRFGPAEQARIRRGFADAVANRKLRLADPDLEEWGARVDAMLARRTNPKAAKAKEKGRAFAEAEVRMPGAVRLQSGAVLRTLRPGEGKSPLATSRVKVAYAGRLLDGTIFDSSEAHGGPSQFPLNGVIPCWTEALPRMKQGEKARLVCPSSTAYGDQGRPPNVPGGATLVFEIELLGVD